MARTKTAIFSGFLAGIFRRTKEKRTRCAPSWSLYRLPVLLADANGDVVYGFEGEGCVEAAMTLGLTATTSAHGCKSPKKSDWAVLAGRRVVWMPDADSWGRKYAQVVAGILTSLSPPASVKIVELPGLDDHGDIADFINDRRMDAKDNAAIRAEIHALAEQTPVWTPGILEAATVLGPYRSRESMHAVNKMSATAGNSARQAAPWPSKSLNGSTAEARRR